MSGDYRPVVSVIVVNYRGADDTITCLEACRQLDWPSDQLELIVVDNASGDGSVDLIRDAVPEAQVISSKQNLGFAGGCNRGVKAGRGEYAAFLNNDARPDKGWLRTAVAALERDSTLACVASKVLDWEGRTVDFVDAGLSFYGHGFKLHVGEADDPSFDVEKDVLFASGAAMVVRRDLFQAVGGFDDRYFMFFEDVDFGWRLWLLGHRVRFIPESVVYHRHHATIGRIGAWWEHHLLERNALFTMFKNYGDELLQATLPAALAFTVRRGVLRGGDDPFALDLERVSVAGDDSRIEVSKELAASALAVDAFARQLPDLLAARQQLQAARKRSDAELARLFQTPFQTNWPGLEPVQDAAVEAFHVEEHFRTRRRILVATGDTITAQMAGPAIRAWQIASELSREHDVVLVTHQECTLTDSRFQTRKVNELDVRKLAEWCDVLIFQGYVLSRYPFLYESDKVIVVDVYDPFHLEQLEQARDRGPVVRGEIVEDATRVLNEQLMRGDFFMCASTKQRDFWLGQLSALGRINPQTYDGDETLESLITVVPFGLPDTAPVHTRDVVKGVVPGIGPNDKVIIWGGGVYNWFDPITLLHAVDLLRRRRPDVRLFFLGLRHPNPEVPEMRMAVAARRTADELGLAGSHVFFNEEWVPYDERQNYLLEADVAVSTHLDHVETAFSFRTRILDYLWTAAPVVATAGDALADLITTKNLGIAVPPGDVEALEEALFRLIDDEEFAALCRKNIRDVAGEFTWSKVLQPLVEFCRQPRRAPDAAAVDPVALELSRNRPRRRRRADEESGLLRRDVALIKEYLGAGGLRLVAVKAGQRLRRYARLGRSG